MFIVYRTMNHQNKYYEHMGHLQNKHREADPNQSLFINLMFDEHLLKREASAKESGISLPDLVEVPLRTPDEKIIKTIASELRKWQEKVMNPKDWQSYTNSYIATYNDTKTTYKTVLVPKAVEHFNRVLNLTISRYTQFTGLPVPQKFFDLYSNNSQNVSLTWTDEIIKFIRKEKVYEASEKGIISSAEKIDIIKFICSVLIQMYSHEDVRQNSDTLEHSRMIFNTFVMSELTQDFHHKWRDEDTPRIRDKSDINYFKDKRYRLPQSVLETKGIARENDIYFEIETRAKNDISVERKSIFDPNLSGASAANDIGGMRFIGEKSDELNMLMINELMNHHTKHFTFNPKLKKFPYWFSKKEETGIDYTAHEIEEILDLMNIKIVDKDSVKMICTRALTNDGPAIYELDEAFFAKHCVTDPFVLAQLRRVVKKRNQDEARSFKDSKKDINELKQDIIKECVSKKYTQYANMISDKDDMEILHWLIKKSGPDSTVRKKIKELREKHLTTDKVHNSRLDIGNEKIEASYSLDQGKCYITIQDKKIDMEQILALYHDFFEMWSDTESNLDKTTSGSQRKIWANDWKEMKIVWDMYTQSGDKFSGEHQFILKHTIENMKPMTVAEVYNFIKSVFETLRKEKILSKDHINTMVYNNLIPMLQNYPIVQNGMSGADLLEKISKDESILPAWWSITDKIIQELTNRGMRELTIDGVIQHGLYVHPKYVKRIKWNDLRLDKPSE